MTKRSLILLLTVSVCACAPTVNTRISITEHHRVTFNKSSTITVTCSGSLYNLKHELEHALLARGYNIVSEEVASTKDKINVDVDLNNTRKSAESYRVRELKSAYLLRFHGSSPVYGTLIDLETGQIVKSLKITTYGSYAPSFVEELIDKMEGKNSSIDRVKNKNPSYNHKKDLIIIGGGSLALLFVLLLVT